MRVGALTGGGERPGLDAALCAIIRRCLAAPGNTGLRCRHGWTGG